MRIRKKKWASGELLNSKIYISDPVEHVNKWSSLFKNDNPISLELGCGKGIFIAQYALEHPNRNFIAIDIKTDILAVAHRNILSTFHLKSQEPSNILLVPYDIRLFQNLFYDAPIVEEIYMNFPNPWYKERHHKRRLTHPRQLLQYSKVLDDDGAIHFKTDDRQFFTDTLGYLKEANFIVKYSNIDEDNTYEAENTLPQSEHEIMYRSKGVSIYYLKAVKEKETKHSRD